MNPYVEADKIIDRLANGKLDENLALLIIDQFGGLDGLAREVRLQYDACGKCDSDDPNNESRTGRQPAINLLNNIVKLILETSGDMHGDAGKTEEDLAKEIESLSR